MKEQCEYQKRCPILGNDFCNSTRRFECLKYRELEEKQMIYEDDL